MNQPVTAIGRQSTYPPLPHEDAAGLGSALGKDADVTVFVDGTALRLPEGAREAVVGLLRRLAAGEGVEMHATHAWLTTAQAAELAEISQSYLRKLSNQGVIPVTYRGTHRRYRSVDVLDWVRSHRGSSAD
jgi:excisionase family DNA binding protein